MFYYYFSNEVCNSCIDNWLWHKMYSFLKTICYVIGLLLKLYRNTVTYLYYIWTYRLLKLMKHLSALTKDFWNYMSLFATMNVLMYILKLRVLRNVEITISSTESESENRENSDKDRNSHYLVLLLTYRTLTSSRLFQIWDDLQQRRMDYFCCIFRH